ncbi:MAG TPA: hypothetical protein VK824_02060 [Planctomycetota bacterium]|nr:hypothetical protein [Planctomycetota bacterium]
MSCRPDSERRAGEAGTTLLECTVALLLFTLLVVGMSELTSAHEQLVSSLDGWLADDPVYFVDQPDDDMERAIGTPARLSEVVPVLPGPPPAPDVYSVAVVSVSGELDPPAAVARVVMTEN